MFKLKLLGELKSFFITKRWFGFEGGSTRWSGCIVPVNTESPPSFFSISEVMYLLVTSVNKGGPV